MESTDTIGEETATDNGTKALKKLEMKAAAKLEQKYQHLEKLNFLQCPQNHIQIL